jgi:transposase
MEHLAIDLGGRKSQICVRSSDGTIVEEKQCPTQELVAYLAQRPKSRVVVETCSEGFYIADHALELGHEARVVPATLVQSLGVGARRTKTDKRDARALSEVSCRMDLPSVHIPSHRARDLKTILGLRDALVSGRTMLINTVRGYLRTRAIKIPNGADAFTMRARELLVVKEPTNVLESCLDRQLRMIDSLSVEIEAADKELKALAKQDPVCPRLMTVIGVGPMTALHFVAAVDDVDRFKSSHHLEAYLGLTPGENSSSERKRRTSITKAGWPAMRRCLVQSAWAARRAHGRHPMLDWVVEIEKRRGKRVAILALARKIAGILFALWRDNTTYDAALGSRPLSVPTV